MVSIAVHGISSRRFAPERALVTVVASATGDDRATVVDAVVTQHQQLVSEASSFESSGAVSTWHADGLTTGITQDWRLINGENTPVKQFRAQAAVTLDFTPSPQLQSWLLEVAQRDNVQVQSISWHLSPETYVEVVTELREVALKDAVSRAFDLARAAGLGAPRLTAIFEPGLRPHVGQIPGPAPMYARMMSSDAAGGGNSGLDLKPQEIEISTEITADFEAGSAAAAVPEPVPYRGLYGTGDSGTDPGTGFGADGATASDNVFPGAATPAAPSSPATD